MGTMGTPARNRSLCPQTGKNNHVKDREDGRKDGQWTGPYCPTATRRTSCKRFPGLERTSSVLHLYRCVYPILSFWPGYCAREIWSFLQIKNCFIGSSLEEYFFIDFEIRIKTEKYFKLFYDVLRRNFTFTKSYIQYVTANKSHNSKIMYLYCALLRFRSYTLRN